MKYSKFLPWTFCLCMSRPSLYVLSIKQFTFLACDGWLILFRPFITRFFSSDCNYCFYCYYNIVQEWRGQIHFCNSLQFGLYSKNLKLQSFCSFYRVTHNPWECTVLNCTSNTCKVFMTYCVFFEDFRIFRTLAFLYFPSVSMCVHTTHQAGRTPALQQNWQSSEK